MDQVTATRVTETPAWIEQNAKVDWMAAPGMADYVNGLVSGKSLADGGHWALHACRRHLEPLAVQRGRGLSMLTLGCGNAHIEASLIQQFGWPIRTFTGLEYDNSLRSSAAARFGAIQDVHSHFAFFDFNAPPETSEPYDIVFTCHALHHAEDVEATLGFVNRSLAPDGRFIGIEYLGPSRFQIEYDVLPHIHRLFALLPPELRRNLAQGGAVDDRFEPATIATVRDADPSESPRSSDLRTLLLASFPIEELKPMGGTLLRWLLQYWAGNFRHDDPAHVAIARLLQFIEGDLIARGHIRSDDMFFALGRSGRLG